MSFWARESYTRALLKSIPQWLRIIITSCFMVIFVGGWGGFFYYPLIQRHSFLEKEFIDLKQQQKLCEQKVCSLQDIQTEYDVVVQKLGQLPCTQKQESQALFCALMHAFKKHELICKDIHPQGNKINTLFEKQYVYFDAKGPFKSIKMFLQDIAEHDFLKYKKMTLLRGKNNMVKCQALVRTAYLRSFNGEG